MEATESKAKEEEMSVVLVNKGEPDYDKYLMEKNNRVLELIAGKFTGALNLTTDINIQLKNLVEISVKSVCEKDLGEKQDLIDDLKIKITQLKTTIDEKEQIIKSTNEELSFMHVELKMYKDVCEKKNQENADLRTAVSHLEQKFVEYKKKTEETERRFIYEKKTMKATFEARIRKLEKELHDYKTKTKTLTKTEKSLDAKFMSMSLDIKQEWTAWFLKFKENMPKYLESVYKELRRKWVMEWTQEHTEEIRQQVEVEYIRKVADMKIEIEILSGKLERLEARSTFHSEVQKYTEILSGIQKSETIVKRQTSLTFTGTTVVGVKAIDNEAIEFENLLDKNIDMTGWTIQDEMQKRIFFRFPEFHLRSSGTVKVWTNLHKGLRKADELLTNDCEDWSKVGGILVCDTKGDVRYSSFPVASCFNTD